MQENSNSGKYRGPLWQKPAFREQMRLACKYFLVGLVVIVFSPIIVPVYGCYAVGKTVIETWRKM